MNILVDEKANVAIKEILDKKDKPYTIKISMESCGWDGPALGLTLYEEEKNDEILNIDGIKFFLDKDVDKFPRDIKIYKAPDWQGGQIIAKYL